MSFVKNLIERLPLSREEILHGLRGCQEAEHFRHLRIYNVEGKWLFQPPYNHNPIDFTSLAGLRLEDADDACNRTAPFYMLREGFDPDPPSRFTHPALAQVLISRVFLYTFDRWLRPYRSEIDRYQFLTKTIVPPPMSLPPQTCSLAMVDLVRRLHANFCARVDYTKSLYKSEEEEKSGQQFYFMQPIFSAVAVALRTCQFTLEHEDVTTLRVVVISTGREENLSAPVRLDSIPESEVLNVVHDAEDHVVAVETTLSAAVSFLLALEKRETDAFGLMPDPVDTTRFTTFSVDRIVETAASLSWDNDVMGPLEGPSSSWVDTEKYPAWTGQDSLGSKGQCTALESDSPRGSQHDQLTLIDTLKALKNALETPKALKALKALKAFKAIKAVNAASVTPPSTQAFSQCDGASSARTIQASAAAPHLSLYLSHR